MGGLELSCDDFVVKIKLEAAPRYVLTILTLKPREAIALAKQVISIVGSALTEMGGHLAVTQEPKLQLLSVSVGGTKHATRRHKNGGVKLSPTLTQTQTQTQTRPQTQKRRRARRPQSSSSSGSGRE